MNSKHPTLSSPSAYLARVLFACAKLCRRASAAIANFVLVSGHLPSPVRAPEIAAFTALAAERAKRRAPKATPAAVLLASASLSL